MNPFLYLAAMLAGLGVTAVIWSRRARRDERLVIIYIGGLAGAFIGAKIAYLLAEGWTLNRDSNWQDLVLSGKSILGALPGGYAGVEITKRHLGFTQVTGDFFAAIVPLGVALGRVGCLAHGCCPGIEWQAGPFLDGSGVSRWPAVPVEIAFNLGALCFFAVARRSGLWPGQHFHLYLIGYGTFRFFHEFLRDTPRIAGIVSGYQLISAAVVAFGIWAFRKRAGESSGVRAEAVTNSQ